MSNYVRYVHFKLDMPYQISSKELMAYTVLVFNRRTGKYFLKIVKETFPSSDSKTFISSIHPVVFPYESDLKDSVIQYLIIYNGQTMHSRDGKLFTNAQQRDTFSISASAAKTLKVESQAERNQKIDEYMIRVRLKIIQRKLTENEKKLLRKIFTNPKYPLDLEKVTIIRNRFWPTVDRAMAPFGDIWFPDEYYQNDFTLGDKRMPPNPALLVHEMTHVWQHQNFPGRVPINGGFCQLFSTLTNNIYNPYKYRLDETVVQSKLKSDLGIVSQKEFSDYNVEAQATIVQDYYSRFLRNGNNLLPVNDINSYNNKFTQKDYEEKLKNHILK